MANRLTNILNKMVKQERWRKKPKLKGIVSKISKTKSGSIKLIIGDKKTPAYILKKNHNLYEIAETAVKGSSVSVAGRRWLGKLIVEKIDVEKEIPAKEKHGKQKELKNESQTQTILPNQ